MQTGRNYRAAPETTTERPSSFREMLLRDRGLLSRRRLDRHIADRASERDEIASDGNGQVQPTYLPALSRMFNGGTAAVIRSTIVVAVLVLSAFLFGLWAGSQSVPEPTPQSATVVAVA